jgi:hypothetical protein
VGEPRAALRRNNGEKPLTLAEIVADLAVTMAGLMAREEK